MEDKNKEVNRGVNKGWSVEYLEQHFSQDFLESLPNDLNELAEERIKTLILEIMLDGKGRTKQQIYDEVEELFFALKLEKMRRKGLIRIKGNGNVITRNTKFELTDEGYKVAENIDEKNRSFQKTGK